jgi:hypothetical protein
MQRACPTSIAARAHWRSRTARHHHAIERRLILPHRITNFFEDLFLITRNSFVVHYNELHSMFVHCRVTR